jgi:hypothetical protein
MRVMMMRDMCDKCDAYLSFSPCKKINYNAIYKPMSHTSHTSQFELDLDEIIDKIEYYGIVSYETVKKGKQG